MDLRRARALLAVVFAATVLIGLNATMLSVALPSAVDDLGASPVQGSWMLLSYLVVSGAGLVLSGQLADCLELAPVFRVGLGTFAVSGLALAASGDPVIFIAARAVQGAGAALLLSTAAAIVTVSHPAARRRGAMGVYLAGFSIAQVSGPMIGGVVTSTVGWRWLFLIGFAIALGALVLGWVPLGHLPRRGFTGLRVDLAGNGVIVVVTSVLLVAFAGVPQVGWTGRRTVILLVVAAVAVPLFVAVEHRSRWPAIAVDLLRDRAFALANVAAFCLCVGRVVPAVVLSLWFQGYQGDDPVTAALKVTPLAVAVTVGTLAVGPVVAGRDDVVISRVTAAGAVTGSALLLAALLRDGDAVLFLVGLVVLGLSAGAFQTVNSTMILGMRPVRRAGTVNGIRTTAQQSAVSLGTALLISLGTARLLPPDAASYFAGRADRLDAAARDALETGHVLAVCVLVGVSAVGLLAVVGLRRRGTLSGAP